VQPRENRGRHFFPNLFARRLLTRRPAKRHYPIPLDQCRWLEAILLFREIAIRPATIKSSATTKPTVNPPSTFAKRWRTCVSASFALSSEMSSSVYLIIGRLYCVIF
jgi:hypothetical protein